LKLKLLATVVCAAVALFTLHGKDNGAVTAIAKGGATITAAGSCSAPLWGNVYVASLKPFSWWNGEYLDCVLTVIGEVTDCNGAPIPSVTVTGYLTGDEASTSVTASTDSNGSYSLQFPANSNVTITVKSSDYANYTPVVSYSIQGVSGGTSVVQDIELPCVAVADECTWNGDTSVVINGVVWATRNVDAPGTFAACPESYGMFYQWNRNIGWSSIDPLVNSNGGTTWDTSAPGTPSGDEWENDPSPAGWRVPTYDEINTLLDTDKVSQEETTYNGVYGRLFTDKTTGKSLFLPAAGFRSYLHDAALRNAGTNGYYWSTHHVYIGTAQNLLFSSGNAGWDYQYRVSGLSVRCVADALTTVMGEVTDCNGAPISSVRVTGYVGSISVTALTDSYGSYRLQLPAYSDITITVKSSDYANYTPEVSYAINNVSSGTSVVQDIELPCNGCFWNGDTSVVINGVVWATRNIDAPGTFADSPESYGMFYQWNRNIGWSSTDPMVNSNGDTDWDSSTPDGYEWYWANDPSPVGWRVPALAELQTLLDTDKVSSEWTACNGVNGRLFTDKTTGKSLFLPAAGYRSSGTLNDAGTYGYYWSSTHNTDEYYAPSLSFRSGSAAQYSRYSNQYRKFGCSVRCVADVSTIVMGEVTDCNGDTLSGVRVTGYLTGAEADTSITTYTDRYGNYSFRFPAYSDITITVMSNDYGNYSPEVSYTIHGGSVGTSVVQDIELPCVENGKTSVVINGIRWATRNVDVPGTFAARPEDAGMFYQWNRKIGWSSTDPLVNSNGGTTWDDSTPTFSTEWKTANDPSPAGWRVPDDYGELETLLDTAKVSREWTVLNGVNGCLFTDKSTGESLFLPAAGSRTNYDGTLFRAGEGGYYWSNRLNPVVSSGYNSYCLYFLSSYAECSSDGFRWGLSVRCVAE
jgi:uncharacterized protein (TIGR02145 family)